MGVCVVSPVSEIIRFRCDRSPRVLLLTDAASDSTLPESIRRVADDIQYGNISAINRSEFGDGYDGSLIWCKGERAIAGSPADWRRSFFAQLKRNAFVAVHWTYLEHADLLGLEPRLLQTGATTTIWNPSLRIAGSAPSDKRKTAWRASGKPWAGLSLTLWQELERPGSGMDSLLELWNSTSGDAQFSALVLRNLIVVLMKCNKWEKAGELLALGNQAFPGCAEFSYLHAVYFILQQTPAKAIRFLETALASPNREFVGSGGENSYRARYLLGMICDIVGQQEKAVGYWFSCTLDRPAFGPAVQSLANQRLPRSHARRLHYPLAELARREPEYLEPIVNFLLAHNLTLPGRRIVETIAIEPARRQGLLNLIGQAEEQVTPRPRSARMKPGIALSGPIFDASGHSRINRAIGQALLESPEFETALDSTTWPTSTQLLKNGEMLRKSAARQLERMDLTIRHQWPPDFGSPTTGKLACILPWEHKAVPTRWVQEIEDKVDELWTPSHFTRDALLAGGVSAQRVHVMYNGIDPEIFRPDGPASRPPSSRGFVFLFVGGLIRRKGIDLLLQAYADAFTPDDDVTLVIKDVGSRSFYSHNTKLIDVLQFAARRLSPHTLVLNEEMDDTSLASLYRGADALVLPYRGEGFGMPLTEAMSCGKPVITTKAGPALEFCSQENGYLIPAREVEVPEPPPPVGRLSTNWTWFEPDIATLAQTMRHVYEHRDEAAGLGRKASIAMEQRFTWKRILPIYLERIVRLVSEGVAIPPQS